VAAILPLSLGSRDELRRVSFIFNIVPDPVVAIAIGVYILYKARLTLTRELKMLPNFNKLNIRTCSAIAFVFFLISQTALASFVVADLDSGASQPALGTNVVIAGQGLEAGMTWMSAAHTQALVFKDRAPHGFIRLVAAVDDSRREAYLEILRKWGYQNIRFSDADFISDRLNDVFAEASPIASIDFIGHDGAFLGFALQDEDSDHRYYYKDVDQLAKRAQFTRDAYIRILGCNTGWFLAPYMAKRLGVAAAGTLTSSDVEIMTSSETWNYDGSRARRASENDISYSVTERCFSLGGCVRLKAVNTSYVGQHGTYTGAVPFLKFFCGSMNQNECNRRMALSTRTLVGVDNMQGEPGNPETPTRARFAATLADQFCPVGSAHKACVRDVIGFVANDQPLDPQYTTLSAAVPSISCTFQRCQFIVGTDSKGQKILIATGPKRSTVMVDELTAYRQGYQLLPK
jgi:hypothetical protein